MFGENLRRLREARGYSQDELGAKLLLNGKPVSGKTISSWEIGRTEPNMGLVQQIADLFKVPTDELIIGPNSVSDQIVFTSAQEAIEYILRQPLVAAHGGYDLSKMTDQQIIDFANEIAGMIQFMAKHYNK